MKKKLAIAALVWAGLTGSSYFSVRWQIEDFALNNLNEFLELIAENNSGVVCGIVEPFGIELPLEFFYSSEYEATVFLLDPKGRPFKVTVYVTNPTFPFLRLIGLSKTRVSIKRSDINELFSQRRFCEP